jgi:hypothetical protein
MEEPGFKEFVANLQKADQDPLMRESDRGLVLLRTADIENLTQTLLEGWFSATGGATKRQRKAMFDYSGPAGTLSAKLLLARVLGLVPHELFEDLEHLRALRNLAAHCSDEFSLSSETARSHLREMHFEYGKEGRLKRYSLTQPEHGGPSVNENASESVMKGHGFLRYDKSNFIAAAMCLENELLRATVAALTLSRLVNSARSGIHTAQPAVAADGGC